MLLPICHRILSGYAKQIVALFICKIQAPEPLCLWLPTNMKVKPGGFDWVSQWVSEGVHNTKSKSPQTPVRWSHTMPQSHVFYMNLTFLLLLLPRVSNFHSIAASGAEWVQPYVAIYMHGLPSLSEGPSPHSFLCSMQWLESKLWGQALKFRDIFINRWWIHAITGVSELILNLPAMVATGDF